MKKILALILLFCLVVIGVRADVLFRDSAYYPYNNGLIEGQGKWYAYTSKLSTNALDAFVTNNVLYLSTNKNDSVGTPTNGWVNTGTVTWASFQINLPVVPSSSTYFVELRDKAGNSLCHI
jgi:hypothetical protein